MAMVHNAVEPRPLSEIESYHAHIYYEDAAARERAALLREWIAARFLVRVGNWHDRPVGPHPLPMFQVAFDKELMSTFVPWLMLRREGLDYRDSWPLVEFRLQTFGRNGAVHFDLLNAQA